MPEKAKKEIKKSGDILDDVKAAEARLKRAVFLKHFNQMKELAHERLRLQEKLRVTCEQLGLTKDDTKRVIDFINECDDVKLTETDLRDIAEEVRDELADRKRNLKEKVEEQFPINAFSTQVLDHKCYNGLAGATYTTAGSIDRGAMMMASNNVTLDNGKTNLNLNFDN